MSYAARILDGLVVEVVELPAGVALADAFHAEAGFVTARETVTVGMSYADGAFGPAPEPEPPSLETLRQLKLAAAQRALADRLALGAPVSALHVALDDGSRADMTAMGTTALAALGGSVPWPASYAQGWIAIENERIPLPMPADGLALAAQVGAFYATLVQRGRDLKDAIIAAADPAALGAIDIPGQLDD